MIWDADYKIRLPSIWRLWETASGLRSSVSSSQVYVPASCWVTLTMTRSVPARLTLSSLFTCIATDPTPAVRTLVPCFQIKTTGPRLETWKRLLGEKVETDKVKTDGFLGISSTETYFKLQQFFINVTLKLSKRVGRRGARDTADGY